jgi:hypothetical protein
MTTNFPLIRGRRMRVTRLDSCGRPMYGSGASVVTSGFVSVAVTAQVTEAEAVEVTNAAGQVHARDAGTAETNGFGLEITFCDVQPCTFEMLTGQPLARDSAGRAIGFKVNTKVDKEAQAFALEVWAGVPGSVCLPGQSSQAGYILFPYVSSGTIGDFSLENAAVTFVVTGAMTKDGNGWGAGPYEVMQEDDGTPTRLPELLDSEDHLYVARTGLPIPAPTDGCVELVEPDPIAVTGVVAGSPGAFLPRNADLPVSLAVLSAHPVVGVGGTAEPAAAWEPGQHVRLGDGTAAHWTGTAWAGGSVPAGR